LSAEEVAGDFHARLSAKERRYRYRIINRRGALALDAGRAWHLPVDLNVGAMHEAAQVLVGHHDFTSFRAAECQAKSPLKTLDELKVTRLGEEVEVLARARSFLHHQVRNMAKKVEQALAAKDRSAAGPTAPPDGLYFLDVRY
jgi:tRNA pseudouridine38-40 synthase